MTTEGVRFSFDTDFGTLEVRRRDDGTKYVTIDSIGELLDISNEKLTGRLKRFIRKPNGEPAIKVEDLPSAMGAVALSLCGLGKHNALYYMQKIAADHVAGLTFAVATKAKLEVLPDNAEKIQPRPYRLNTSEVNAVDGKGLYEFMEVKEPFSSWISRVLSTRTEHVDYERIIVGDTVTYMIDIKEAKHICLLEDTTKGRWARNYFIEFEENARKHGLGTLATVEIHQRLDKLEEVNLHQFQVIWSEMKSQRQMLQAMSEQIGRGSGTISLLHSVSDAGVCIREAGKALSMSPRCDNQSGLPVMMEGEGWITKKGTTHWTATEWAKMNGYLVRSQQVRLTQKGLNRIKILLDDRLKVGV